MNEETIRWHVELIPPDALNILDRITAASVLDEFYLAGRTGLALTSGHRRSRDFDFFSRDLFDENLLLQKIKSPLSVTSKAPHTLHLDIDGIKITFLGYSYPLLFPANEFNGVKVADVRDIACMKIDAISSRGAKRDFIDLYIVAQKFGLPELLKLFDQKYSETPFNRVHILKSLTYFDDVEQEPIPEMLIKVTWDMAKEFFLSEVPRLL